MSRKKSGFTLVEILIVVIILGILAAVVIPQFASATGDTRESSVMANLKAVRSQLQLYRAQHQDIWPDDLEAQLTSFTDVEGNTNATYTSTFRFGPYMVSVPPNPWTGSTAITTVTGVDTTYSPAGDMNQGWWYNSTTGEFRAHVPDSVVTEAGVQINTL
jgi:general secretion pathway protein G